MLDIAFKATLRKEIIERTLDSFYDWGCIDEDRIVCNVDNIGVDTFAEVRDVISRYTDNIDITFTEQPHSGKAYKTILDRCKSDYVLMLEDDWELLTPILFDELYNIFNRNPDLQALRFMVACFRELDGEKLIERDGWYEIPEKHKLWQLTTRPTLFRGSFIKKIMQTFDGKLNLEKWMMFNDDIKKGGRFGICPNIVVRDIGRAWRAKHGYRKGEHDINGGFTKWVKCE